MLKASCWAGNVGELAKQRKSHQLPAVPRLYTTSLLPCLPFGFHASWPFNPAHAPGTWTWVRGRKVGRKKTNIRRSRSHPISVESWAQQIQTICFYLLPTERAQGECLPALEMNWHEVMSVLSGLRIAELNHLHAATCQPAPLASPALSSTIYQIRFFISLMSLITSPQVDVSSSPLSPLQEKHDPHPQIIHTNAETYTILRFKHIYRTAE